MEENITMKKLSIKICYEINREYYWKNLTVDWISEVPRQSKLDIGYSIFKFNIQILTNVRDLYSNVRNLYWKEKTISKKI